MSDKASIVNLPERIREQVLQSWAAVSTAPGQSPKEYWDAVRSDAQRQYDTYRELLESVGDAVLSGLIVDASAHARERVQKAERELSNLQDRIGELESGDSGGDQ